MMMAPDREPLSRGLSALWRILEVVLPLPESPGIRKFNYVLMTTKMT